MAHLAEKIDFGIGDWTGVLRPSLQGALRIAREFGGFKPVLKGIQEGSITIISRVIREGVFGETALPEPLFEAGERGLYSDLSALQLPAIRLLLGWMGHDPDAKPDDKPANDNAKPSNAVEDLEALFGFATGILKWTSAEAWAATPREIMAAANFRTKFFTPADKTKPKLTLDQQAMLLAARLDTRAS